MTTEILLGAELNAMQVIAGHDLTGRNAIVTGASSGIGIETARALASAGADVTLAVRDLVAGQKVAAEIREDTGNPSINCQSVDLGKLQTIASFAANWGDRPLHYLINNAGIMMCPYGRSADGIEIQYAVNFLGPIALTMGLMPALLNAAPSRIVMLSSLAHRWGPVNFDDLEWTERDYEKFTAYAEAKSALILFSVEFARRYPDLGVTMNCVHPGAIMTALSRHLDEVEFAQIKETAESIGVKTPGQGAATSIWAAVAPELTGRSGLYLEDCSIAAIRDEADAMSGLARHAIDPADARKLWNCALKRLSQLGFPKNAGFPTTIA